MAVCFFSSPKIFFYTLVSRKNDLIYFLTKFIVNEVGNQMNYITRDSLFDLDKIFTNQARSYAARKPVADFAPKVDILESEQEYQLIAELAGINKEAIEITINDGVLTISADPAPEENTNENYKVLRRERKLGKFSRVFNIGDDVAQDGIEASFKEGLLYLSIPKLKATETKTQKIEIH